MRTVDLRSDTITKPTPAMRRAMAEAEVGDDVFGEDPTVNRLEAVAAELMGKEAALFVASGTMGNLVSLLSQCGRGDEVILGDKSHTYLLEQGGMAALGGIHPRPVPNEKDGSIDIENIREAIRADNVHFPRTRLIALENTHNRCHGAVLDPDYMRRVRELANTHGLKVHVDGARIFNAAVALGVKARDLAAGADSITFCLSKALSAPVGSVVCGTREFIAQARRARKVVGGGLRQAGVLAAAGLVALDEMVERLAEDHANARKLGEGLAGMGGLTTWPELIRTNIIYIGTENAGAPAGLIAEKLKSEGVLLLATGAHRLRAVTNCKVSPDDIEFTLKVFRKVMG